MRPAAKPGVGTFSESWRLKALLVLKGSRGVQVHLSWGAVPAGSAAIQAGLFFGGGWGLGVGGWEVEE